MRRPRTLRWRLVIVVTALLFSTMAIVGVVTIASLHGYLYAQLDGRLAVASARALSSAGVTPPSPKSLQRDDSTDGDSRTRIFLGAPGQSTNTVMMLVISGKVIAEGYFDDSATLHSLSASDQAILRALPVDSHPFTRDLGGSLGQYRVSSSTTRSGAITITGLPLAPVQDTIDQLLLVIASVTVAALVAAAIVGAVIIQSALKPLRRVAATASAVTGLSLGAGEASLPHRVREEDIESGSEVGLVGTALNELLAHVETALSARQAAEERMRIFVADAGHELRTPLATVRAYAELSHPEYTDDIGELRSNIARIETETARMTSLVEDLLLLARLDSEPELRESEVDLSGLVVDAVVDARTLEPRNIWLIEMDEEPVLITGDRVGLRQVVVNLLANARVHTEAGTTVQVSLHQSADGTAVLDVTDNGPGIDPALTSSLFERFVRGDTSRSTTNGSTGLGLSIVRAVVQAHPGDVSVTSTPGHTRFRVRLFERSATS